MEKADLNLPSVRTERSWRTNQNPRSSCWSLSVEALTVRLPIKLRVNMEALCGTAAAMGAA